MIRPSRDGRWLRWSGAVAGVAIALGWPMAAPAQDAPRLDHLSAPDLFALADRAQAAGRKDDALAFYDALAHDPNGDIRAEARFRKAMLLAAMQRYTEAATAFRALLDEKPDAVRARLELARVLAAMGDEAGARRALRQAQASGLPEDVAITVDQFARALRVNRPLGGSVELAVAPDSNINRATQARTLDTVIAPLTLSDDARARSGLGVRVGGQGFARIPLSDRVSLLPRLAGVGVFYRSGQFNDVSGSALLGLEWRSGRDRISPSIGQTWRWYGGEAYARTGAAALDWLHPLGLRGQLLVHGGASRARYDRNDLQDGGLYDASIGLERAVSARTGFGMTLSGYRQTARDPGYATVSGGVTAVTWRDLGKLTLVTSASINRLEGDTRLFLFPDRRREWLVRGSAALTVRQLTWAGSAPNVRLIAERNVSTVGLYDYRRVAMELGIVRAF